MILVTNSTAQTLAPGQAITFDTVLLKTGDAECCRNNAARTIAAAKLRKCGNYIISFEANITRSDAVGEAQLSIQVSGTTLPETTAVFVPPATNVYGSIAKSTVVSNGCETTVVTVVNTGTTSVIVAPYSALFIRRISGGID